MPIHIGTNNPGSDNKKVGGTSNTYSMGGGTGVCGTPVWNDLKIWDDNRIWVD